MMQKCRDAMIGVLLLLAPRGRDILAQGKPSYDSGANYIERSEINDSVANGN